MSINPNAPRFVLAAVNRLYSELANLIGADAWTAIQPQIDAYVGIITNQPDTFLAATQLRDLLETYEPVRQRLSDEIKVQDIITQRILSQMAQLRPLDRADSTMLQNALALLYNNIRWQYDLVDLPQTDREIPYIELVMRGETSRGGMKGAKSIKFSNISIDLRSAMLLLSGTYFTTKDMNDPEHQVLSGIMGVAMMIGTLLNEMTIKIDQTQATVLWGVIFATSHRAEQRASFARICEETRKQRQLSGLFEDISDEQIRRALDVLTSINVIEHVPDETDTWRLVETFVVRG
jgi:hypothetical protein